MKKKKKKKIRRKEEKERRLSQKCKGFWFDSCKMVLFLGFGWGTSPNPRFEGYGGDKTLILGYLCKDLRGFCIEGYD